MSLMCNQQFNFHIALDFLRLIVDLNKIDSKYHEKVNKKNLNGLLL